MQSTRRLAAIAVAAAGMLGGAAPASARIVEIGSTTDAATPSCPAAPCQAVSRTTGFQVKVGTQRGLFSVPEDGRIVAWSVTLGKPAARQVKFFDSKLGGPASAGITVLRFGRRLAAQVVGVTPMQQLQPYFGQTVQFPLAQSIAVTKGQIVALTVPTWAPVLALGFQPDTAWRASRRNEPRSACLNTELQTAQTGVGVTSVFQCLYRTARLTYSATLITNPPVPQTNQQQGTQKPRPGTR